MKKVLLIKDGLEEQLLQILTNILHKNGWTVLESTCETNTADLEATKAELIVCYSENPLLASCFEKIKSHNETKTIPIFLVSVNINQRMRQFGNYVDGWVTVPFSENEFIGRLMRTLAK
jgi:DNA-binding response OmpR family regulator